LYCLPCLTVICLRFYAEDSSLIHGTLGKTEEHPEPVFGSLEINHKIMSLNFKDCHAKIRQVDSLETLKKGVVVQVTGELSSNQQPMRRFLQTFVLAPQSPTNYYVRNDIFRYLDDVFSEEEEGSESERVSEVAASPARPLTMTNNSLPTVPVLAPTQVPQVNAVSAQSTLPASPPKQINGHPEKVAVEPLESPPVSVAQMKLEPKPVVSDSKPLSWASRVADNVPVAPVAPVVVQKMHSHGQDLNVPPVTGATSPAMKVTPGKDQKPKTTATPPRGKKIDREGPTIETDGHVSGDERKPGVLYGDEQQVFVGNLPQDISEEELRTFFSKYGNIADVRINRTNQKNGAGRTPNYGLVTFTDAKVVTVLLSQV